MKQSSRAPLAVSIALHVAIGAVLLQVLILPNDFASWLRRQPGSVPVERIGFLQLPTSGTPTAGRSGGDDRPARPEADTEQPSPLAPPSEPAPLPPPPAAAAPEEGSGPLIGTGGPARGIRPSYTEPRVWVGPARVVVAPKPLAEALGATLSERIKRQQDSLEALGTPRKPGDWTFMRDGKKYGMDSGGLYLGDVTIPGALLPRLRTDNILALDRARQELRTRLEIEEQSRMRLNENEFRIAVRNIRERKERERARATQAGADGSRD